MLFRSDPSNLQILCRGCNYLKNPRIDEREPLDLCVNKPNNAIQRSKKMELEFREFVYEQMYRGNHHTVKKMINAGAEKCEISPVTAKRYMDKMLSERGILELRSSWVYFKENYADKVFSLSDWKILARIEEKMQLIKQAEAKYGE